MLKRNHSPANRRPQRRGVVFTLTAAAVSAWMYALLASAHAAIGG